MVLPNVSVGYVTNGKKLIYNFKFLTKIYFNKFYNKMNKKKFTFTFNLKIICLVYLVIVYKRQN